MPTYSYACTACDNKFDIVQSFSDESLTACPQCTGKLRKLFNSVGIVFKGSGFYRTDSRSGGTSSESATPAKTETKSDSAPAAASTSSTSTAAAAS
ncbi:FmdB family zinc ribbon protein [Rhodococcus sp. NPDC060090]|uniref:FmdB family zinc ribbon protein n=1 Tax=Rhodococcus sp. NPDC060090 TaxID=3347056 RepID=UPI00364C0F91